MSRIFKELEFLGFDPNSITRVLRTCKTFDDALKALNNDKEEAIKSQLVQKGVPMRMAKRLATSCTDSNEAFVKFNEYNSKHADRIRLEVQALGYPAHKAEVLISEMLPFEQAIDRLVEGNVPDDLISIQRFRSPISSQSSISETPIPNNISKSPIYPQPKVEEYKSLSPLAPNQSYYQNHPSKNGSDSYYQNPGYIPQHPISGPPSLSNLPNLPGPPPISSPASLSSPYNAHPLSGPPPLSSSYNAHPLSGPPPLSSSYNPHPLSGPPPISGPYNPHPLSGPPPISGPYNPHPLAGPPPSSGPYNPHPLSGPPQISSSYPLSNSHPLAAPPLSHPPQFYNLPSLPGPAPLSSSHPLSGNPRDLGSNPLASLPDNSQYRPIAQNNYFNYDRSGERPKQQDLMSSDLQSLSYARRAAYNPSASYPEISNQTYPIPYLPQPNSNPRQADRIISNPSQVQEPYRPMNPNDQQRVLFNPVPSPSIRPNPSYFEPEIIQDDSNQVSLRIRRNLGPNNSEPDESQVLTINRNNLGQNFNDAYENAMYATENNHENNYEEDSNSFGHIFIIDDPIFELLRISGALRGMMLLDLLSRLYDDPGLDEESMQNLKRETYSLNKSVTNDSCVICQDEFPIGVEIISLNCKHGFHEDCITTWFQRSTLCPLCKSDVRE